MSKIPVRMTTEFEIDPEDWVKAAEVAEEIDAGVVNPKNSNAVANGAVGYCDPEDHLPRWAREAMKVTQFGLEVL